SFLEQVDGLGGCGHIGAFGYADDAVLDQHAGIVIVQLVLGGAGQGDVHRHVPGAFAFLETGTGTVGIFVHAAVIAVFHFHQDGQLVRGETAFLDDCAAGVGDSDHGGTQGHRFFDGVLGDVAGAGD